MKLYGRATSLNVQKILWFIEELGLDYEHIELGGKFKGLDTAEFHQLNPMGKVPVLVDAGHAVWESHTILRYLAATYAAKSHWYSQDAYERSIYERWMDWAHLEFQSAFIGIFQNYYRVPPSQREVTRVQRELDQCRHCLNALEEALTDSDYIAGSVITLADLCCGIIIYRLISQGLTIELPLNVANWYVQLQQRPGYQKWVMTDFSELQGRDTH
ncbi:glutathione S-transferase family protein [Celerinatantimonas sp. YJH-8]|uniref:glutathione S-transferase family protein n=1 Tax=Celerinatantimonas sp. YJH-8 TaxID=3228714 RepID=UPI0038BF9B65